MNNAPTTQTSRTTPSSWRRVFTVLPGLGATLLPVGACPACWPGYAGFLSAAGLGFLWFNAYPASMFMGDVGSLALGAALGTVALATRHEVVLVLVGGIFVAEALSVIFQVGSYKLYKRRIFRMAPIHHHFELQGWPEPLIIVRFWIISIILSLAALATLKLR